MNRFDGKVVMVTGASQGIGEAIARAFAAEGAKVLAAARNRARLDALVAELATGPGEAVAVELDVVDVAGAQAAVKGAIEAHGVPDVLVNNAGITADNLLMRMKLDEWDRVLRTNLTGVFAVTQEVAKGMVRRRSGRIINVSSVVGLMGNAGQTNYAASKAGLIGFTKSLAREIGSRGITVNAVAPGYIATPMTDQLNDDQRQRLEEQIVLGRLGKPDDVAQACLFLASEDATYVTGEVLNVSGGLYM